MANADDVLKRLGLKFEELNSVEKETYFQWLKVMESNQLTVMRVRRFVHMMRVALEEEMLKERKQTPSNFLSLLSLFIPFYGLIKKWYSDEHRNYLEGRIANLILIESFLLGPKRAKEYLDQMISNTIKNK